MSAEEAAREAAEEAERQKEEARQREAAAAAAASKPKPKGKGKKSRSPSPKKGGKKDDGASTPQPREFLYDLIIMINAINKKYTSAAICG